MPVEGLTRRPYFHVSRIVADIEAALQRLHRLWDAGSWRIYALGPDNVTDLRFGERPLDFSIRLAITDQSPQLELIQPLDGESIYSAWLAERGEGVHHVGVIVESVPDTVGAMRNAGFEPIQWARGFGDAEWAYFDTVDEMGLVLEAVQPPTTPPEPDAVWPRTTSNGR